MSYEQLNKGDSAAVIDTVGFCTNSRRWVDFMLPRPPKSCPYVGNAGETHCINDKCGYYEERAPSAHYNSVRDVLTGKDKGDAPL